MSFSRKIYWTDGNTINMANMDGSNGKILHQNQREPVGRYSSRSPSLERPKHATRLLVDCISRGLHGPLSSQARINGARWWRVL